jgi:hypothetical protein
MSLKSSFPTKENCIPVNARAISGLTTSDVTTEADIELNRIISELTETINYLATAIQGRKITELDEHIQNLKLMYDRYDKTDLKAFREVVSELARHFIRLNKENIMHTMFFEAIEYIAKDIFRYNDKHIRNEFIRIRNELDIKLD